MLDILTTVIIQPDDKNPGKLTRVGVCKLFETYKDRSHQVDQNTSVIEFEPGEILIRGRTDYTSVKKMYEIYEPWDGQWMHLESGGHWIQCTADTIIMTDAGPMGIGIIVGVHARPITMEHIMTLEGIKGEPVRSIIPRQTAITGYSQVVEPNSHIGYKIETESGEFIASNFVLAGGECHE